MPDRKYSVAEIDRMRWAVTGMYLGPREPAVIEERLRTYMLNGTEPEELEAEAEKLAAVRNGRFKPGAVYKIDRVPFSGW